MNTIRPTRAGLILAVLLGGWHLMWSLLVAVGWAQLLINFIFWIHFIKPIYVIEPFNIGTALLLIVVTSTIGYVVGWGFGVLWNKLHK
jgi:hypothetical protein